MKDLDTMLEEYIEICYKNLRKYKDLLHNAEDIYPLCKTYVEKWKAISQSHADIIIHPPNYGYQGISINFYLSPNQNITKDVEMFVDDMNDIFKKYDFYLDDEDLYIDGAWKRYVFSNNKISIHCIFHFNNSNKCKIVGTGEFVEKKKVVCE